MILFFMEKQKEDYRKGLSEVPDEYAWTLRKIFWKVIVPIVLLVLVLSAGAWVFRLASQPARIVEKTFDADNVLYNYEWFKRQHEEVMATDTKITNAEAMLAVFKQEAGPRKDWTFEDKNESARLSSVVLGLQNYRAGIVKEYNARSRMANRAIFKRGVPEFLE